LTDKIAGMARRYELDVLRCAAILMVLIYHGVQMSPIESPLVRQMASFGQYGVDLFFVLSGWLIGGLYWRERLVFGDVNLMRFWVRRWIRTIPPYLVALCLSFGAVFAARREPFDPGYLLFIQNYYERIPFFLVSWSLCVEEHFYLLAPIWFGCVAKLGQNWRFIHVFALAPLALRFLQYPSDGHEFGFSSTATHLRFEGLYIGFAVSAAAVYKTPFFMALSRHWLSLLFGSIAIFAMSSRATDTIKYTVAFTAWAVFFTSLLLGLQGLRLTPILIGPVRALAVSSYSLYLMHPLGIHVGRYLCQNLTMTSVAAYIVLASTATACLTALMYFVVERNSILVRDLVCASRRS
jgi:peptidoglycan/LPS O-acetylase OafA/YrhL